MTPICIHKKPFFFNKRAVFLRRFQYLCVFLWKIIFEEIM